MRRGWITAFAALVMAGCAHRPAEPAKTPLFDAFQKYCIATGGKIDAIDLAATGDGFVRYVGTEASPIKIESTSWQRGGLLIAAGPSRRTKAGPDGQMQEVALQPPGAKAESCTVRLTDGGDDSEAATTAWAGVPALSRPYAKDFGDERSAMFQFRLEAGKHLPVALGPNEEAVIRAGGYWTVLYSKRGNVASIMLTRYIPPPRATVPREQMAPLTLGDLEQLQRLKAGEAVPYGGGRLAQTLSNVGREDLVARLPLKLRSCKPTGRDPVRFISEQSKGQRIVMINEAHDRPETRAFVGDVAAALRPEGFTDYGAETFNKNVGETGPAWPRAVDGTYTDEPVFGQLFRRMRLLGYRFFPYEHMSAWDGKKSELDRVIERETGQATAIAARLASAPKDARFLIHAGYGHINEHESRTKWMAMRFHDMTGIDPLTIDQTVFRSPSSKPVVCEKPADDKVMAVDIYVGLPVPTFERSRPQWRRARGERFVEIPPAAKRAAIAVYEARYDGEPEIATPADRILVMPGEDIPLLLPDGIFRLRVWTEKDGWSETGVVKSGR